MLDWKKFDPENPPERHTDYFIFAGGRAWVAQLNDKGVWVDGFEHFGHVTHYAEIAVPD